jgi:hypothetical protein
MPWRIASRWREKTSPVRGDMDLQEFNGQHLTDVLINISVIGGRRPIMVKSLILPTLEVPDGHAGVAG